ncbi:MAG: trehalose-6-phosphate synthase [Bacteroidales bacterium]
MKQIITALFIIVLTVSLIAVTFTFNQVKNEEERLTVDLQHRSTLLAESFRETIEPNFINKSDEYLQTIVEKFADRERFAGMAIYDHKGNINAMSSSLPKEISKAQQIATDAMDEDKANGDFVEFKDKKTYLLAIPLHEEKSVVGALMIAQNAGYIDSRLTEIWQNSLIRLFLQIFLLTIAISLIIRWLIFAPVRSLAESLKSARIGNSDTNKLLSNSLFLQPITKEVANIRRSLLEARLAAGEEAKANLEKLDSPWTAERLKQFVKNTLQNRTIVVVSNREPYIHTKVGNKINYYFPASGMVTAIEPIMQACGGTWIAHGSGDADRLVVDKDNRLQVPPDEPKYTLKRVWLTEEEEKGHYYGFSNEGLWALCHIAHTRPIFRKEDWEEYKKVNGKFAQTVLSEIRNLQKPIIFIQDFHFALLPRMIKRSRPDATIGLFWHVPWVSAESFSICPWKKEILDGMLGADLVGFHTQLHCNNFIETVGRELESLIDFEQFTVTRNEHVSFIKPFPISIAFSNGYEYQARDKEEKYNSQKLLKNLGVATKLVGVGVDRLDYTKGILERLKAIEIFLKKYPSYQGHFTFIQIAAPSRSKIKKYREFAQEVEKEVERINTLFSAKGWKPIFLIERHHDHEEINQFYKLADFCLVTSLHDGMNLVAKEFVASRSDEKGVLILSQFTGASRELKDALIVNPYNGEQTAEAIHTALEMPPSEQTKRMKKLRETVKNHNAYRWSAEFLKTMVNLG